MSQDNSLIAATLTVAVSASRQQPLPNQTEDGKTNLQLVFNEYEQFLELLEDRDRKQREPGMAH